MKTNKNKIYKIKLWQLILTFTGKKQLDLAIIDDKDQ
jgi:hypothetical protein